MNEIQGKVKMRSCNINLGKVGDGVGDDLFVALFYILENQLFRAMQDVQIGKEIHFIKKMLCN